MDSMRRIVDILVFAFPQFKTWGHYRPIIPTTDPRLSAAGAAIHISTGPTATSVFSIET